VTLGTSDLPCVAAFYDTLLAAVGAKRLWGFGRRIRRANRASESGSDVTETQPLSAMAS